MITSRVRKAFVLGAGLGTRLRPLTNVLPKPLLPIFGKPLITFAFDHLISLGVEHIIANTHHMGERFVTTFPDANYRTARIELIQEKNRLETGGGIKNVEARIGNEPFLVYSGDILTDIDLETLLREHFDHANDVTLALRSTGLAATVGFTPQTGQITDLLLPSGALKENVYDFAGVSVWNPSIFERIPSDESISFVPILVNWLKDAGKIGGVLLEENTWFNIGSRTDYLKAHRTIFDEDWRPLYIAESDWPFIARSEVFPSISVSGASYVGSNCQLKSPIVLEDSIILSGSSLESGTSMKSCVVAGVAVPAGNYQNSDFA